MANYFKRFGSWIWGRTSFWIVGILWIIYTIPTELDAFSLAEFLGSVTAIIFMLTLLYLIFHYFYEEGYADGKEGK